jgi:glucose-6-phosphate dehydrogenase assembly protein OpcA
MSNTVTSLQPEAILKELGQVWAGIAQGADPAKAATLRACAMTLIVATQESHDRTLIDETIAKLMHEHPCRAIVLILSDQPGQPVQARAVAQCWMPFGTRQQICSEQIEIRASIHGLDEIHAALLGLLVPDLPVVLWCWGGVDFMRLPQFQPILRLPDKIIVDSDFGFGTDGSALSRVERRLAAGLNVADLNWTRLTRWREEVARLFDTPREVQEFGRVRSVEIAFGTARSVLAPLYLGGWFRTCWGPDFPVDLKRLDEPCEIRSVRVAGGAEAALDLTSRSLERHVGDLDSCVMFPALTDYDLLREELRIVGRDSVFERVVTEARRLAQQKGFGLE